jgi:hypothetical protein
MSIKVKFGFVVLLGVCGVTSSALAVPRFPRAIQQHGYVAPHDSGLDYAPPCSVCHVANNTGVATADTPFAFSLRARGLNGDDRNSLETALSQLDQDQVDSDGDGMSDVDELFANTDPNSAANAPLNGAVEQTYGCALSRTTPLPARRGMGAVVAVAMAALLRKRRRALSRAR